MLEGTLREQLLKEGDLKVDAARSTAIAEQAAQDAARQLIDVTERLNSAQTECDLAQRERDAAQGEIAALKHAAETLKATIEAEHGKEESRNEKKPVSRTEETMNH